MILKTKILPIILLLFAFPMIGTAQSPCENLKACERKLCELKTELEYAKKHGNTYKIKRIEEAIDDVQKNCTTNKVYDSLDKKIKKKEEKIKEITEDLNNAIKDHKKPEKIEKIKRKLEQAKLELDEAILARNTK